MEKSLKDNALEYAKRGWKVFPLHSAFDQKCTCGNPECKSAAKHPRIKEWQRSCSLDQVTIENWWQKWPDANIGLATGEASGFFVLDVDPRHGGKESLQQLVKKNGSFPKTLAANTGGGGFHFFFKEPGIKLGNRANLLPGLDIRADGGYIVAPPSTHASGLSYSWMKQFLNSPVTTAPDWLLRLCTKTQLSATNLLSFSSDLVREGGRNDFLFREASRMRGYGFEQSQLLKNLREINFARCLPPLSESEVEAIGLNVSRYPSGSVGQTSVYNKFWDEKPKELSLENIAAPELAEELLPKSFKPWIMDISERMQVTPEFVMAPALVGLSSIVGRKIGIHPKQKDDWFVIPNLWGAIVARPGYFKSPTISEAMKPLDNLIEKTRSESKNNQHFINANKMVVELQLEALKENVKRAIKAGDFESIEALKNDIARFEKENEETILLERRYKTNDATVEKVARLLNENPNGLLLLRDELNGWLQALNKSGREGDREFYLESWNGYGSYTVDRVGSGTLHVPALCLSVFGGIQPGKLQAYVEKTLQGAAEDDGLLQRFQILIYPELSPKWVNIDRSPDLKARQNVFDIFSAIDKLAFEKEGKTKCVRFSNLAQEVFDEWRHKLESRLRSNEIGCSAFESHLAKYRKLMPSLALLFWLLEDPNHYANGNEVSFESAMLAIQWCDFLEKHANKAYRIGQSAEALAVKSLSERLSSGQIIHKSPVRSVYRRQWTHLKTPQLVERALEVLEEHNWLKVVQATVQGGKSKRIMVHPQFRKGLEGN